MPKGTAKKQRKVITLQEKKTIIERVQNGEKQIDLAKEYGVNKSTVGTIWSSRDKILDAVKTSATGALKIYNKKQRHPAMDEMEKLLIIWIEGMQMRGDPVSGDHICTKARKIFEAIVKDYPGEEEDYGDEPFEEDEGQERKGLFLG
jgi:hypothetical protein